MLKRVFGIVLTGLTVTIAAIVLSAATPSIAQSGLATLVPPTLFPTDSPPTATPVFTISALADILANKDHPRLTIGILYNAPPFAKLDMTGQVVGFEADLGHAIAQDWGIQGEQQKTLFKQVTRQTGISTLLSGGVDLLMGKVIHTRELDKLLDFSDAIFVNHEVALTLGDYPKKDISELGGATVGVVAGSPADSALIAWQKTSGVVLTVKRLPIFDDGVKALAAKTIDALIDDRWSLDVRVRGVIAGVKLLTGSFRDEPYAIAIRAGDDNLRTLVNRTLQRLADSGRYDKLYDQFSASDLPKDQRVIPIPWSALSDDTRTLSDFSTDILLPKSLVIPQMAASKTVRVAGIGGSDATGKLSLLDTFDQALATEMARRWGVTAQFIPNSAGKGEDLVASGAADLAVGIEPHWGTVDRVDFVSVYATHGYRLMIPVGRNIAGFADLLSSTRWVGVFAGDANAFPLALKLAKSAGVISLNKLEIPTDDELIPDFRDQNITVAFGDSLRLMPIAAANPKAVTLTDKEYTKTPIAFAVPRNDSDFRALVEETLQDMAKDGTYQRLWKDQFNVGDPLPIVYWP